MNTQFKRWKIELSATINGRDQYMNDFYFASTKQDAMKKAVEYHGDKLLSIISCSEQEAAREKQNDV